MSEPAAEQTPEPEQEWEHPQEALGATEPPVEGEGDAVTPDAEASPSEPADEAESPEQPEPESEFETEPQASAPLSEKDIDRIYGKMDKYREANASRVAAILGGQFEHAVPCPLCSHFSPGYIGLVDVPEDAIPPLRAMLGMPDLSTFSPHPSAHTCPTCEGKGETLTGSHVPNFETLGCPDCGGKGYVGAAAAPPNGQPPAESEGVVTGPTVAVVDNDDPAIRVLKERGFTVIPPMPVPQA